MTEHPSLADSASQGIPVARRTFLRAVSTVAASAGLCGSHSAASSGASVTASDDGEKYRALDEKIRAGMAAYAIPGVAVGVLDQGTEYVRGFGVTDLDHPVAVDGDTLFRIGSTTKTFTGTTMMRLLEQGKLDLDAPVRAYLPEFRTADPAAASQVTVRQLVNHSAGWLGDYFQDFGVGDDALTRYAAGMVGLPQLTPPGAVFAYNNAAVGLAGRLIEVVTDMPYERAVRQLLIDPLGLTHSRFFVAEAAGFSVATSHAVVNGKPVTSPALFPVPRSLNPAGGLISSVRDQLRYARFQLGNGTTPRGQGLLTERSLVAMRSNPGPGGTIMVELDGVGVNWLLRPSAEGVRIVQHGGDWPGQHSGLLMVPERGFALTLLTNSLGGPKLVRELFSDDWALRRFAGISNLPAVPQTLSPSELAPYEGHYTAQAIDSAGAAETTEVQLTGDRGQLAMTLTDQGDVTQSHLAFYRRDYVLSFDANDRPTHTRADFLRGPEGDVGWFRRGGRLYRRQR
ncbi:MAG: serine hydrolase domain-containing protein [Pseudonocardiaceae bacterium]